MLREVTKQYLREQGWPESHIEWYNEHNFTLFCAINGPGCVRKLELTLMSDGRFNRQETLLGNLDYLMRENKWFMLHRPVGCYACAVCGLIEGDNVIPARELSQMANDVLREVLARPVPDAVYKDSEDYQIKQQLAQEAARRGAVDQLMKNVDTFGWVVTGPGKGVCYNCMYKVGNG